MSLYAVDVTEDPSAFLLEASEYLRADPLLTTIVTTVTDRAIRELAEGSAPPPHPRWWATVRDERGELAGVAMRTAPFPPYPLFVLPMAERAALSLARALHSRGQDVRGVNGSLPAASVVADELARLGGGTARIWERTRLFELKSLVEPALVRGEPRLAALEDLGLCLEWFSNFHDDAAEQAGRSASDGSATMVTEQDLRDRIREQRVLLWEVDGEPVHLCGFNAPSFGVARIGPVYTPKNQRGCGYASVGVAEVSRRLLSQGARVCLFTDQANPTSNKIYTDLGFEPVVDMANLSLD